jgi:FLVCR family MFS transporter 7
VWQFFAGLCGSLFIVFGVVGAGVLGLFVDKTKMFTEVTKVNMALSALACIAFAVVSRSLLSLRVNCWALTCHTSGMQTTSCGVFQWSADGLGRV